MTVNIDPYLQCNIHGNEESKYDGRRIATMAWKDNINNVIACANKQHLSYVFSLSFFFKIFLQKMKSFLSTKMFLQKCVFFFKKT